LGHEGGVLKSSCHAQEFLQQVFRALTQEEFAEGLPVEWGNPGCGDPSGECGFNRGGLGEGFMEGLFDGP
jgi:hypothetical protein